MAFAPRSHESRDSRVSDQPLQSPQAMVIDGGTGWFRADVAIDASIRGNGGPGLLVGRTIPYSHQLHTLVQTTKLYG